MATNEAVVRLPTPHKLQREIEASAAKRKVVICGRRVGKTTMAARVACNRFKAGRRVLYAAPRAEQTDAFWTYVTSWLSPLITAKAVSKNETRRVIEGIGGRIRARTAWDADGIRGDYADDLIFDEWPLMHPNAWDEVGAPMLLDNNGDAWFMGTPKRKNHGYTFYVRGLQDGERWRSWQAPSTLNPYLSQEALDDITADMTDESYRQEILAEFLENEGAVFSNIAACLWPGGDKPADHAGHTVIAGVDWGKKGDYTFGSVFCTTCAKELTFDRFRGMDYPVQRDRLADTWRKWGVSQVWAESNSMGEPNIDQLRLDGWNIQGKNIGPTTKGPFIESLVLAFQREEAKWIDDKVTTAELEAYERKVGPTGRSTYSAPTGVHDDSVMGRGMAWHGANRTIAGSLMA